MKAIKSRTLPQLHQHMNASTLLTHPVMTSTWRKEIMRKWRGRRVGKDKHLPPIFHLNQGKVVKRKPNHLLNRKPHSEKKKKGLIHSCNSLSGPVVTGPALKGEEKNKICRKATNPHSGEDFGDLNSFWGFFCVFFIIHLFYIVWREGQGRYEFLTMVGAGGTRTCVHLHVSRPLYHCATDANSS